MVKISEKIMKGAIKVIRNSGGGGVWFRLFHRYEGVRSKGYYVMGIGGQILEKKCYVNLEWPQTHKCLQLFLWMC